MKMALVKIKERRVEGKRRRNLQRGGKIVPDRKSN
jgi:hypothetical protein